MSRIIHQCLTALLLALCNLAANAQDAADHAGTYVRIKVPGPSLEGNLGGNDPVRDVSIYLPPSYARDSERRYPVIYLLHGYTDSDANWFGLNGQHFVNVPEAMDAAWEQGAGEMIIVMPNAFTRFWGSMYSSSVTTGDWEAYVAEDLVAHIDANYRTLARRESRGLAGHSMGGYGALRIAMKYPGLFAAVYAMSPCCMAPNMNPDPEQMAAAAQVDTEEEIAQASFGLKAALASAAAWSPNPGNGPKFYDLPIQDGEPQPRVVAKWAANAPLTMAPQHIPELKSFEALHFDAGTMDFGIVGTVHELDGLLADYGVDHVAEEYEGDHVNRIHERLSSKLMPMFSEHLSAAP